MQYPTLYSKDSLGNIRIWFMEQNENQYRTISGLQDGEKVVSEWSFASPKNIGKKNETTAVEQAQKEIESKYSKQKKTGYFDDISNVDNVGYVEPMLAKLYKNYSKDIIFESLEWGAQTKYNGICCVATKNGCFTRKGEKFFSIKHIEESLSPFFEKYPNSFLHGELFNDEYRESLNEIVKLCRKTVNITKDDLEKSKNLIEFYIYDGCIIEEKLDQSKPYNLRKDWIDSNIIENYEYCTKVETSIIESKSHLDEIFKQKIDRGDEGLIIRKMNMKYEHKRSKNLLKYKPIDSDEMTILGVKEGSGNWAGKAKIITVKTKENLIFDATFKGNMQQAEDFLLNSNDWIGKIVTISYFGKTGLGCPQYAQLDINNCLRLD